jgi:hypothetical protein
MLWYSKVAVLGDRVDRPKELLAMALVGLGLQGGACLFHSGEHIRSKHPEGYELCLQDWTRRARQNSHLRCWQIKHKEVRRN